jgi:hypothetical protein
MMMTDRSIRTSRDMFDEFRSQMQGGVEERRAAAADECRIDFHAEGEDQFTISREYALRGGCRGARLNFVYRGRQMEMRVDMLMERTPAPVKLATTLKLAIDADATCKFVWGEGSERELFDAQQLSRRFLDWFFSD